MKKELDLIIFIISSGSNVRSDNLTDTIVSLAKNIGENVKYKYYMVVDLNVIPLIHYLFFGNQYRGILDKDLVLDIVTTEKEKSWANHYNIFFEKYNHLSEYILISHDDLEMKTSDFWNKTKKQIKGYEDQIGWITYTSDFYYAIQGHPIPVTARCGFEDDRENWPYCYECHNFTKEHWDGWSTKENLHLLDMPEENRLVKIHAPMSSLFAIKSENQKRIGYTFPNWTMYTMLVDEDCGMSMLINNLWNVWVPSVYYTHPLRIGYRKSGNKWEKEAHRGFETKWKIHQKVTQKDIEYVKKIYGDTNLVWSIGRNTYDWDYLDKK